MDAGSLYREQQELAKKAILIDSFGQVKRIGGADCSYLDDELVIGGLVVLDYEGLKPVYRTFSVQRLAFPYVPGLLAYREAGALMEAVQEAKVGFDVLMVDGFGANHPRRCGIATHIGVKLDVPAIGVGKSFLCGEIKGEYVYQDGERVAKMLYPKGLKRPIYVSPGHRISLETAAGIVLVSIKKGRLPEPLRLAHEYVTQLKKIIVHPFKE
ncbi:Endonuclease V [Methanocella conradii HZ254]|uniref:Endonuclease V n=1 Tax=Methanocella conradii (strain DSM 24694 / JCM 17849 / CGMCC 1.5162 / HZ254) TaxID=1041930 RepID=H8I7T3_METCZ|nr:endonuclease V [Methanocella conradii]AFC99918.1 Endonuclease V [Methanocella conradii HZ254]